MQIVDSCLMYLLITMAKFPAKKATDWFAKSSLASYFCEFSFRSRLNNMRFTNQQKIQDMYGGIKVTIIDIQTPPAAGGRNGVGLTRWTATGGACCFCSAGDARSPRSSFFHTQTQAHRVVPTIQINYNWWKKSCTTWDVQKPCKQWGFQLPTSTGDRRISEPSTVG